MGTTTNANGLSPNPGYTPVAKEIIGFPLRVDQLITLIKTPYSSDYWFEKGNTQIRDLTGQAGEKGAVQKVERSKGKVVYQVEDRAFETFVPRRTEQAAQQQSTSDVQDAVVDLSMLTRTRHEAMGAALLTTDSIYKVDAGQELLWIGTTNFTKWALPSTGHPITDIYYVLMRLGAFDPAMSKLSIGIGTLAMAVLAEHTDVLDAIKYSRVGGRAGPEDLKVLFNKWVPVDDIFILQATVEDYYGNSTPIWPTDEIFIMITQRDTPSKSKPTGAACIRQEVDGEEIPVYTGPSNEGAHGGTYVKVAMSEVFKVINNRLMGRLKDAV